LDCGGASRRFLERHQESKIRKRWLRPRSPKRFARKRSDSRYDSLPCNPLDDIKVMVRVAFVMKDGVVVKGNTK
jgi:hypothetical protein